MSNVFLAPLSLAVVARNRLCYAGLTDGKNTIRSSRVLGDQPGATRADSLIRASPVTLVPGVASPVLLILDLFFFRLSSLFFFCGQHLCWNNTRTTQAVLCECARGLHEGQMPTFHMHLRVLLGLVGVVDR